MDKFEGLYLDGKVDFMDNYKRSLRRFSDMCMGDNDFERDCQDYGEYVTDKYID